ncbi:MAG: patatin-like phospholipase family protein [Betaproteobacteria bacterium]|nr:patatin-like phospholipase family protein [Betaproteobacteria bacterium]
MSTTTTRKRTAAAAKTAGPVKASGHGSTRPAATKAHDGGNSATAVSPGDLRSHVAAYEEIALVLQGGGALGAYQAGVVQGLTEAGIHPTWVAGISIGSIHCAIIAGNPPHRRAERLREFWHRVTQPPLLPPTLWEQEPWVSLLPEEALPWMAPLQSLRALAEGQRGFFVPRPLPGIGPDQASVYDTAPLRATLEELVDFDLLNSGAVRVSVGAVNLRTGNLEYFDTTERRLGPEHFMASGALPPGFPAVRIGDDLYWDGGLVSNTPLSQVLGGHPRAHTLVFQVDLWSAAGEPPRTLADVGGRVKDIQYSSRTRAVTDVLHRAHEQRNVLRGLLERIPPEVRKHDALCAQVEEMARDKRYTVIHLIYGDKPFDGQDKDFQFGRATMRAHWNSGLRTVERTLAHTQWFALPSAAQPFVTHDVHRERTKA